MGSIVSLVSLYMSDLTLQFISVSMAQDITLSMQVVQLINSIISGTYYTKQFVFHLLTSRTLVCS